MDRAAFLKAITRPIPTMPVDVIREADPPETGAVIVKKPPGKSKSRKNAKRTAYQREYQREYMRKKREAVKAECKLKQPQ